MPFKDQEKRRKFQREWIAEKRKKENKMPTIETLRKYYPNCSASDQELLETAEWVRTYEGRVNISPDNKILAGIINITENRKHKKTES